VFFVTFQAGEPLTQTNRWTVPVGAAPGGYLLSLGVYNPAWHVPALAYASTKFAVSAASASE